MGSPALPSNTLEVDLIFNPIAKLRSLEHIMGLLSLVGLRRRNHWQPLTLLDHILSSPLTFFVSIFYSLVLLLRGHPFHPPRTRPPIRVVSISDTHDQTVAIPDGDILIHAGDLTDDGTVESIQKQLDWLKRQKHPVKIVIAGNHDSWFDPKSRKDEDVKTLRKPNLQGLTYLESTGCSPEIRGRTINIFGVPDIPTIGPREHAFQYDSSQHPWLSKVPPETDILVTHTPPFAHRDLCLGCPHLLRELWRVRPRLHVFGHVHFGAGTQAAYFNDLQARYETLMSRPRLGLVRECFPCGLWLDVLEIVYLGVESVLWKWVMSGPGSNDGTLLVNAAQMVGDSGRVKSRAVVVDV